MKLITFAGLFLILCACQAAPSATGPTATAALIAKGKHLFEAGRFKEAKVLLEAALLEQPDSKPARYYLDLAREAERAGKIDPRQHTPRHPPLLPPRRAHQTRT